MWCLCTFNQVLVLIDLQIIPFCLIIHSIPAFFGNVKT